MQKLFVLDASGFLYRSYFAIRHMTNEQGESTNALFGFIRSVTKVFKDFDPTHVVAVFDGPQNIEKRKQIYSDYKANREETPKDLPDQIEWAKKYCEYAGIPFLSIPKVEADDTMGSIAMWGKENGFQTYLCTSDKDLCQMVDDRVHILNTFKENEILTPDKVEEKFGVKPHQMIDYLAIVGDTSDNVPGISGFGPKMASKLLEEHETLNYVLSHPEVVKGKKRETLESSIDQAKISQKLVTIDTSVPVPDEKPFYEIKPGDHDQLKQLYLRMNFRTLLKEVEEADLFDQAPTQNEEPTDYRVIDNKEDLESFIHSLTNEKEICIDTETTGLKPLEADLVGIGISTASQFGRYIPLNGSLGKQQVLDAFQPLLSNKKIGFFGHNIKYDAHVLESAGIPIATISFDTMLASYLLNAHHRHHSLDALSLDHFRKVKTPITDLIGKGKNQITMQDVPIDQAGGYCCEDVDYTVRLKTLLENEIKERGLSDLLYEMEIPLIPVLMHMERNGIFVDVPLLQKMGKEIVEEIQNLQEEIFKLAGEEFNLNSPKQLSEILFVKLQIPAPKKTATGFSTSAGVLEALQESYPIATFILEYRTLEKLRSTYIEALPKDVNPKTGRIHCNFNQLMTATGRLSSQDPNLQNIPIRTDVGRKIRRAFRPEENGWMFLSADYSQIELRLLAHFSEDPKLLDAFCNGKDIHAHTAATILDIPIEEVTKTQRYHAKAVNFGILYGQGAFGLSQGIGISRKEAQRFIDCYFERYEKVQEFIDESIKKVKQTGRATTLFGRQRLIPDIQSKNRMHQSAAERLAVNTPLQGTQADIIKIAMIRIDQEMRKTELNARMLLQIHDALLFEVPENEIDTLKSLVKKEMEGVIDLKVPLTVDVSIGKNWESC